MNEKTLWDFISHEQASTAPIYEHFESILLIYGYIAS